METLVSLVVIGLVVYYGKKIALSRRVINITDNVLGATEDYSEILRNISVTQSSASKIKAHKELEKLIEANPEYLDSIKSKAEILGINLKVKSGK